MMEHLLMQEVLEKLEHAFWDMADILADNLPEGSPDEEDLEVSGYIEECRERFACDRQEFNSAMKVARKKVREFQGISD